ncbi:hypothetical protein NP233_g8015 [Leucocoprinus birnbaumii]|uniref:Uncharacterized protein n=1 Tax=Leucocoprinus birnbaumii TaxID=56174 RepID=A0AAD5VN94_9AGAR|nr:hypothetical protein NP233_g8015 [Leucocoprinus birnbaumii]
MQSTCDWLESLLVVDIDKQNIDALLNSFQLDTALKLCGLDQFTLQSMKAREDEALGLWLIDKAKEAEIEAVSQNLYRGSVIENIALTDAELEEQEFLALFPSCGDSLSENTRQNVRVNRNITSDNMAHVSQLHVDLFSLQKLHQVGIIERAGQLRKQLPGETLGNLIREFPESLDASALVYRICFMNEAQAEIQTLVEISASYNFYQDANLPELKTARHVIMQMRTFLKKALAEWSDQMVSRHLIDRCDASMTSNLKSPVAKVLSALKQRLLHTDDWEMSANHNNSLSQHRQILTKLIVRWQRLELSSWNGLMGRKSGDQPPATSNRTTVVPGQRDQRLHKIGELERHQCPSTQAKRPEDASPIIQYHPELPRRIGEPITPKLRGESSFTHEMKPPDRALPPQSSNRRSDIDARVMVSATGPLSDLGAAFTKFNKIVYSNILIPPVHQANNRVDDIAVSIIATSKELSEIPLPSNLSPPLRNALNSKNPSWSVNKKLKSECPSGNMKPEILQQNGDDLWLKSQPILGNPFDSADIEKAKGTPRLPSRVAVVAFRSSQQLANPWLAVTSEEAHQLGKITERSSILVDSEHLVFPNDLPNPVQEVAHPAHRLSGAFTEVVLGLSFFKTPQKHETKVLTHLLSTHHILEQIGILLNDITAVQDIQLVLRGTLPFLKVYQEIVQSQLANHAQWTRALFKLDYVRCTLMRLSKEGFCQPPETEEGGDGEGDALEAADGNGQVEGLKGEDEGNQERNKDEGDDNAVEMSEDFGGALEDVPDDGAQDDKDDQSEGESETDPEERMEDLDPTDPSALDEKMWGDESGPKETDQVDKTGKDHWEEPSGSSEVVGKGNKEKSDKDSKQIQQENEPETEKMDGDEEPQEMEDHVEDQDGEPNPAGAPMEDHIPDANTLGLPDDIQLEAGEEEKEKDASDDEFEGTGEEDGAKEDAGPDDDAPFDHDMADGQALDSAPQADEGEDQDMEMYNPWKEVTARPDMSTGDGDANPNDDSHDQGQDTASTGQAVAEPTGSHDNIQEQSVEKPDDGKGHATSGVEEGLNQIHTEQRTQVNPLRSLGDTLKEIRQRFDEILNSEVLDQPEPNAGSSDTQPQLEYLQPDDEDQDMQALGPAGEEQVVKLNELKTIEGDSQIDPAAAMNTDEPSQPERHDRLPETQPSQNVEMEEEVNGGTVEAEFREWQAGDFPGSNAEHMWRLYESLTQDLAYALCEQLRLILEPTLATRLKGDCRTGKRLNMKKIIPYIASDYTEDKIWLRRTKPSQREYQILISIDDSRHAFPVDESPSQPATESSRSIGAHVRPSSFSPISIRPMYALVDLNTQKNAVLYLGVQGSKQPLDQSTLEDIQESLCLVWPQLVEDCIEDGIEGPICGVIVNDRHQSLSDSNWHATLRLFDRYNCEIVILHSPMPNGHELQAFYTTSRALANDGKDFARDYPLAMKVSIQGQKESAPPLVGGTSIEENGRIQIADTESPAQVGAH